MIPRIIIAAPGSGSGKTTATLALMAALRERGVRVAPFKVGPDYIDPQLHEKACGRPSLNLDTWLTGRDGVQNTFARGSLDADIAVIEGVMGLFDGSSPHHHEGSAAEVAELLDAPVVLVVDASGMAGSVGALVHGYSTYLPGIRVAGVLLNNLGGDGHFEYLKPAIAKSGARNLGYLPRDSDIALPERYLGILPAREKDLVTPLLGRLAAHAEKSMDLDGVLELAASRRCAAPKTAVLPTVEPRVRIAWAADEAFHFDYQENRNLLREFGAEIVPFSPIHDTALPSGVDAIWIGGGFPEEFAAALSANKAMRGAIRAFGESGKTIYAECGGLMYLAEWFRDRGRSRREMAGLIPGGTYMTDRLQRFGYAEATFLKNTPLGPAGTTIRGHRFHYSAYDGDESDPVYRIRRATGGEEHCEGVLRGHVLATYFHIHLGNRPACARHLMELLLEQRSSG